MTDRSICTQTTRTRRVRLAAVASLAVLSGLLPLSSGAQAEEAALPATSTPFSAGVVPGAEPVGTTRYPVPATGAFFVAPTGSDSATGTVTSPWRTVAYAVTKAPAGSTLVLRRGTYHETVNVPRGKRLTIQSAPGEEVWFDGSVPVNGWVVDGNAWRKDGWTAKFDRTDPTANNPEGFRMIDPAYPLAGHPDMVFVDGGQLRQVASRGEVVPGTFYVDYSTSKLWVGTSPVGREVRASALSEALYVNGGHGSVVRGIGFRRYATPMSRMAAVKGMADDLLFENTVVTDNALGGLLLSGSSIDVRESTFCGNGQVGISANYADGAVVAGNEVCGNNREEFSEIPVAGGMKFTASRRVLVRDNEVSHNEGTGIWFDRSSIDVDIVRNVSRDNARHGVLFEISARGRILGNVLADNAAMGIRVIESNDVEIWNNTLVRNWRHLDGLEGTRDAFNGNPQGHDPRYPTDTTATFALNGVVMRNNILWGGMPTSKMLLNVDDATKQRAASSMVSADHNAYYRPSATLPSRLVAWANWPTSMIATSRLSDFQRLTGQEARGKAFDNVADPFFVDAGAGDYALRSGGAGMTGAAALPSDLAALLAADAGTHGTLGAPVR